MACAGVLREVEIVQNGTCGHNGHVHAVYAEALERGCAELLAQAFVGGVEREEPVFHLIVEIVLRQFVDGFCS